MFHRYFRSLYQFFSATMPYYAVRIGRNPGVYKTWGECKAEVENFPKARYKKFDTELDAKAFVSGFDHPGTSAAYSPSKEFKKNTAYTPTKSATSFKPATSPSVTPSGSTPHKNVGNYKTELIDKEMEVLKERLKILEREKTLAIKEQELEEMKKAANSPSPPSLHTSRGSSYISRTSKHSPSHAHTKPYSRPFSTSTSKASRKVKVLEFDEVKKLAKESADTGDSADGVIVYTDGACVNNGRHQAQAGIGVYWGPNHPCNVSERLSGRPTNNRAEIHAVVKAVKQAQEMGISELNVHTDSQFLINSMTKWIHGWKRNGWKLSTGGDVINRADFEALMNASKGVKINYTHVRGHKGIAGNEAADRLAVQGASKELHN